MSAERLSALCSVPTGPEWWGWSARASAVRLPRVVLGPPWPVAVGATELCPPEGGEGGGRHRQRPGRVRGLNPHRGPSQLLVPPPRVACLGGS